MYIFAPGSAHGQTAPYATWEGGFTSAELEKIVKAGTSRILTPATIGNNEAAPIDLRLSKTAWIPQAEDTHWLYDRLAFIARKLNSQNYGFNLYGFCEDFQFTVYEDNGGHYTWHQDNGSGNDTPRKLSLVVQLSDPKDYEGGDLQVFTSAEPVNIPKQIGLVVAFPGYTMHRVTPVTKGIRRTLVVWITGPAFK